MKRTESKKYRNHLNRRQIFKKRHGGDKPAYTVGERTGFHDALSNEIITGDIVRFVDDTKSRIVLYDPRKENFGVFSECVFGDRNPFNPDSYAQVDFSFHGKPHTLSRIIVQRHYGGNEYESIQRILGSGDRQ